MRLILHNHNHNHNHAHTHRAVDTSGSWEKMGLPLPQQLAGFPMPLSYRPFDVDATSRIPRTADCNRFDCMWAVEGSGLMHCLELGDA